MVAIAAGDLHLSHRAPLARSAEKDWYRAMRRPLEELSYLAGLHRVPVLLAGDIFHDGWRVDKCPPELINFALDYLPLECYAVPGQHDLPHHRLGDMHRSAFATLVKCGRVKYLSPSSPEYTDRMVLHGFPWGTPILPCDTPPKTFAVRVAVVHRMIWAGVKRPFPGAPHQENLSNSKKQLRGYDVAVFGDNHKGFVVNRAWGRVSVANCGAFMRRTMAEKEYRPFCVLINEDGTVTEHFFDTSKDKFIGAGEVLEEVENLGHFWDAETVREFVADLETLAADAGLDFQKELKRAAAHKSVKPRVRRIIVEVLAQSRRNET